MTRDGTFARLMLLFALLLHVIIAQTSDGERSVYACQDEHIQLDCSSGRLVIVRAVFGRYTVEYCNPDSKTDLNTSCGDPQRSIQVVTKLCGGRTSCLFNVTEVLFEHDPCPDTRKYAEVHFDCRKDSADTAALSKARTSTPQPHTGCMLDGKLVAENDSWQEDECVRCRCRDGLPRCEHIQCPLMPCSQPLQSVAGLCCPVCLASVPPRSNGSLLSPCPPAFRRGSTWPPSQPGVVMTQCPDGARGKATWRCTPSGWLKEPSFGACVSEWTLQLETALDNRSQAAGDVVHELADQVQRERLFPLDLQRAVDMLDKIQQKARQEISTGRVALLRTASTQSYVRKVNEELVGAVDSLLDARHNETWLHLGGHRTEQMASKILASVEASAFQVVDTFTDEEALVLQKDNLRMEVRHLSAEPGASVVLGSKSSSTQVKLPASLVQETSSNGSLRVVYVEYRGIQLYLCGLSENSSNVSITSAVLSISLNEPSSKSLSTDIELTFQRGQDQQGTPICAAWIYDESTLLGSWSSSGCKMKAYNASHIVCSCDHLTSFAVLMDMTGAGLEVSDIDRWSLMVITYTGCCISIVCLALAWATFQGFRALQSERNTIHKNLVLCLLIGEIVFVAGIQQTDKPMVCATVAALLHFWFLAAFAWMALEGLQIYVMLVEVFAAERPRVLYYYLAGYVPALFVVVITLAVRHDHYGTQHYCWLDASDGVLWAFLGPVAVVLLVNSVFLSVALYIMCRHADKSYNAKKRNGAIHNARTCLKGACVLIVLLGLTWLFGFLFLDQDSVVMAYLFTVFNSLQGVFIFLFHCLLNDKVQKEYHKLVRKWAWLPQCIRLRYGGHVTLSKDHTPSTSSSNPLIRIWSSKRRGKSSSFSSDKSAVHSPRTTILHSHPCVSSQSSTPSSLLYSRPSSELVVSANGELRVVLAPVIVTSEQELDLSQYYDVSVVDSEAVSDYCREQLRVSAELQNEMDDMSAYKYSASYLQPRRLSAILETEKAMSHSDISDSTLFEVGDKEQRRSFHLGEAHQPDADGLVRTRVSDSENSLLHQLLSERASALGLSKSRPQLHEDSAPVPAPHTDAARHFHSLPRSAKFVPPGETREEPVASGRPSECTRLLQRLTLTRGAEGNAALRDSGFGDESDRDNGKDDAERLPASSPRPPSTLTASDS